MHLKEANDTNYVLENIDELMRELKKHDETAYMHSVRVGTLATEIAQRLGESHIVLEEVCAAGLLHDIGKLSISAEILNKKEPLTNAEYNIIKKHTDYGYRIAKNNGVGNSVCSAILSHHEYPDGSGYHGITNTSDLTKIIIAADCMDIMLCGRPYQKRKSTDEIIESIKLNTPKQFDGRIADVCIELAQFFKEDFFQ